MKHHLQMGMSAGAPEGLCIGGWILKLFEFATFYCDSYNSTNAL